MTLPDPLVALLLISVGLLSALSALWVFAMMTARLPVARTAPESCDPHFVFEDGRMAYANAAGLTLIGAPVANGGEWAVLRAVLEDTVPGAGLALDRLAAQAAPFHLQGAGKTALSGQSSGSRRRILLQRSAAPALPDETSRLGGVVAAMPCLAWTETSDGRVTWANPAYTDIAAQRGRPDVSLFRDMARGATAGATVRCMLAAEGRSAPAWFDLIHGLPGDGEILNFAIPADPVVKAEAALRQFVQALTQIFAHLPIGLAVFDRDRRLAMFNPALAELTGLKPGYLSERPDLRAVLDRLREARMLPEQRNYTSWREALIDVERAAKSGTYEENWDLSDGRTFRITGRPHPDGALAFLIEDITPALALQRQFRAEIDLGQSLIDSTTDAIAVFTAEGNLTMTNSAFSDMFGFDPAESVAGLSVEDFIRAMRSLAEDSTLWEALVLLARTRKDRTAVEGTLRLVSGRIVEARLLPLSHGATMCRFQSREVPALPQRRMAAV